MNETSHSLLQRVQTSSDAGAWRRLVDLYSPFLMRMLQHFEMPAAECDDLIQEVFAVLVREIGDFQHNGRRGAFRNWLRTIAIHRMKGAWRIRQNQRIVSTEGSSLDDLVDPSNTLEQLWDREHDAHVARQLMELLEPEFAVSTWEAFRRQVLAGESAAVVAVELGISVNAALIAKSRVIRRFRAEVAGLID